MANSIRFLAMDAVQKAGSGHPGMPMGMADIATVLFTKFLKFDVQDSKWPDRDRFLLSNGHGSMLQYSVNYLVGYPDMTIDQIKSYRILHSKTPGHPEYGWTEGVEATTGPLGQGLAMSVGMAIAEAAQNQRYGADLVDHRTYAFCGDGCLMEGISHEAIDLAGHLQLKKLTVLWDNNHISIDGNTAIATGVDQIKRFQAARWHTIEVDGHDQAAIAAALTEAQTSDKPTFIACKTTIGFGAPTKQGTEGAHGAALGEAEIAGGAQEPRLELSAVRNSRRRPRRMAQGGRALAEDPRRLGGARKGASEGRGIHPRGRWPASRGFHGENGRLQARPGRVEAEGRDPQILGNGARNHQRRHPQHDRRLGGSDPLQPDHHQGPEGSSRRRDYSGSYIRYGIREFGMSAAMNGIALHGGFIPYGGTFLIFSDYARNAIRLASLMGIRVVCVLTHDSIGLGEDGPTHQPIEQLASLRAMPNLQVFRPADAVETAECWELALGSHHGPSALALSRQNLPTLRTSSDVNLSARGAYVLSEPDGARDVTLLATGSEVELAMNAAKTLREAGKKVAVVSMPCWELFEKQDASYRASVLGKAPRVAVEAACGFGWERYIGEGGGFVGMHSFGASGSIEAVYKEFGITAEAVVAAAHKAMGK